MSMRDLEREIREEAKKLFNNLKLRNKDIMEWSTAHIKPHDGEVTEYLKEIDVFVAVKTEMDKR